MTEAATTKALVEIMHVLKWILLNYPDEHLGRNKRYELCERLTTAETELLS